MTDKELERLERIAVQLYAGALQADRDYIPDARRIRAHDAIKEAQELIKQLDALKIAE